MKENLCFSSVAAPAGAIYWSAADTWVRRPSQVGRGSPPGRGAAVTQQAAHPRRELSGVAPCWIKFRPAAGHRLQVVVAGLRAQAAAAAELVPAGLAGPAAACWVRILRVLVVGAVCSKNCKTRFSRRAPESRTGTQLSRRHSPGRLRRCREPRWRLALW